MINPRKAYDVESLRLFKFLGILMGVSIRTKRPLNLHLTPSVWKQLVGIPLTMDDIEEVRCNFKLSYLLCVYQPSRRMASK